MVLFWSSWLFWCCLDSRWFLLVLPKGLEEVSTGQATWFFSVVVGEKRWIPLLIAHEKKRLSELGYLWLHSPCWLYPPIIVSLDMEGESRAGLWIKERLSGSGQLLQLGLSGQFHPSALAEKGHLWPIRKGEFFPSHLIFGRALKKFLSVVQSCLILPEGLSLDSGRISLPELLAVFRSRVGGLLLSGVRMQDAFHCAVSLVMGSQANLLSFYHPQGPSLIVFCAIPSCI